jgi:CHAT domain-containing protein
MNKIKSAQYSKSVSLLEESKKHVRQALSNNDPENNLKKAITLARSARSGFVKNTPEYAYSLCYEADAKTKLADLGINQLANLQSSAELYRLSRQEGFPKNTLEYFKSLTNEASVLGRLANLGEQPLENLHLGIRLYTLVREYVDDKTGCLLCLLNEVSMRLMLANFEDPEINLGLAINLCEDARNKGLIPKSIDYAKSFLYEGTARNELANLGICPDKNLNEAIRLFKKSREEGLSKEKHAYGDSFIKEGTARWDLAKIGMRPVENLEVAIPLFEQARKELLSDDKLCKAQSLSCEAGAREYLSRLGINPQSNVMLSIALSRESRNNGFNVGTTHYAISLINEGVGYHTLARMNINPILNLNKAIKFVQDALSQGLEDKPVYYAGALKLEGDARADLAMRGKDSKENVQIAESLYLRAKDIFENTKHMVHLANVYTNLGKIKFFSEDYDRAYTYLEKSIKLIEELRVSVANLNLRRDYFETVITSYQVMVLTCVKLSEKDEKFKFKAFYYVESAKGRTFLELLWDRRSRDVNQLLLNDSFETLNIIASKEVQKSLASSMETISIDEELEVLRGRYKEIIEEIKDFDQRFSPLKSIEVISVDEVLAFIGKKCLIEYFLGEKLIIFVISKDHQLIIKEVNVTEDKIKGKVADLRKLIKAGEEDKAKELLIYFNSILINPVKEYLSNELILVPSRWLHYIPFEALLSDTYIIERHSMTFAQSATSLKFLTQSKGAGALIVGNPTGDLKHSETEAKEVAKYFETHPLLRREATKERILKEMKERYVLHFSCHGFFDPITPSLSGIILHNRENISALDFMANKLNAELTVLSACETGLADINAGDEFDGLVRAIQYSGSRFVIASLWTVDDESTKDFFMDFYEFYKNKNLSVVEAMQSAELISLKKHDLYYWSPFRVYGI